MGKKQSLLHRLEEQRRAREHDASNDECDDGDETGGDDDDDEVVVVEHAPYWLQTMIEQQMEDETDALNFRSGKQWVSLIGSFPQNERKTFSGKLENWKMRITSLVEMLRRALRGSAFYSEDFMRRIMDALELVVFMMDNLGLYGLRNAVWALQRNVYSVFQVVYAVLFLLVPTRQQQQELNLASSIPRDAASDVFSGYHGNGNSGGHNHQYSDSGQGRYHRGSYDDHYQRYTYFHDGYHDYT